MKVSRAQIKLVREAMKQRPEVKAFVENFFHSKGYQVPEFPEEFFQDEFVADSADWSDQLTDQNMDFVSRPTGLGKLHASGVTGEGVTIAVVDSGITQHADLDDSITAFRDFTGRRTKRTRPSDSTGHGTHVAGIIAGSNPEIPGIAPDSELIGCRVNTPESAIKAIDWVIANKEKYSIDVLNLSLGVDEGSDSAAAFRNAAERAVDAGLIVVAAAGNECTTSECKSTISSPGNSPEVITVGALDDRGTSKRSDDRVYSSSSRGTENNGKPDLVAEGVNILAPLAKGSSFAENLAESANYLALAGSSQAVPMVSGAIALMLQVNPDLTHGEVKDILKKTADKLKKVPKHAQGAGRLDLKGAVASAARRAKKA